MVRRAVRHRNRRVWKPRPWRVRPLTPAQRYWRYKGFKNGFSRQSYALERLRADDEWSFNQLQKELSELHGHTQETSRIRGKYERRWVESVKPRAKDVVMEEYLREVVKTVSIYGADRPVSRKVLARGMATSVRRLNRVLPVLIDAGVLEGSLTARDSGLTVRRDTNLDKGIKAASRKLSRPRRRRRDRYYPTHAITRLRYRKGLARLKRWAGEDRGRILRATRGRSYRTVRRRALLLKEAVEKYRKLRRELRRLAALADAALRRHETDPELVLFGSQHPIWVMLTGDAENSETAV